MQDKTTVPSFDHRPNRYLCPYPPFAPSAFSPLIVSRASLLHSTSLISAPNQKNQSLPSVTGTAAPQLTGFTKIKGDPAKDSCTIARRPLHRASLAPCASGSPPTSIPPLARLPKLPLPLDQTSSSPTPATYPGHCPYGLSLGGLRCPMSAMSCAQTGTWCPIASQWV